MNRSMSVKQNNLNKRPRIKPVLTTTDRLVETIGWLVLLATWILILRNYAELPGSIPIHFDATGQPDAYGDKGNILIPPLIAVILYAGLTLLNKFPHLFNYPVKITVDNAARQYRMATRMIRYLKLIVVLIFGILSMRTLQLATGNSEGLGRWLLPIILAVIFIPLIYYIIIAKLKSGSKDYHKEN